VSVLSAFPLAAQGSPDDPYSITLVMNNLRIAERIPETGLAALGPILSSFQRLGDGASIALLKILDDKEIHDPTTVHAALYLIRQSFSHTPIISLETNKNPE